MAVPTEYRHPHKDQARPMTTPAIPEGTSRKARGANRERCQEGGRARQSATPKTKDPTSPIGHSHPHLATGPGISRGAILRGAQGVNRSRDCESEA